MPTPVFERSRKAYPMLAPGDIRACLLALAAALLAVTGPAIAQGQGKGAGNGNGQGNGTGQDNRNIPLRIEIESVPIKFDWSNP